MSTAAVKEFDTGDIAELSNLAWSDIASRLCGSPSPLLALTGASGQDDRTILCVHLASSAARRNRRVLLADLDRTAVRFRRRLEHDSVKGFSDFSYRLYDEPFFSRHIDDYGLNDLIHLIGLKGRTGKAVFRHDTLPPAEIELKSGVPLRFKRGDDDSDRTLAETLGLPDSAVSEGEAKPSGRAVSFIERLLNRPPVPAGELCLIHRRILSERLAELGRNGYVTFDLTPSKGEVPSLPPPLDDMTPGLGLACAKDGYIMSHLERVLIHTKGGFSFLPRGHLPLREKDFASRAPVILNLLRRHFDVVIVNTPVYDSGAVARRVLRLADGAVLVVKSRGTDRRRIARTTDLIRSDGIRLLGAVLTDAQPEDVLAG